MGRAAGSYGRFTCRCGRVELVRGGNDSFRCVECKPKVDAFTAAKRAAHHAVATARRLGLLADPRTCKCIEYDHRDYTQPLVVDPVCRRCNLRRGPARFEQAT